MQLRTATLDDLETILAHRIAMFSEMGRDDPRELTRLERVSREYFESAIPADRFHAVLAEVEGRRIVGGGGVIVVPWPGSGMRRRPWRPWILNIYVDPEFRRRGIARAIMENLICWCRLQGFDSVSLHASSYGRPLYERLGFKPTNEMKLELDAPSDT